MRIGLTGGIGSGKSTVATMLAQMGAAVVDADAVSRQITGVGGAAIEPIRQTFGAGVVTEAGALNREHMRAHVFAHPEARTQLEAITHPLIRQIMLDQTQAALTTHALVVMDIPLLAESNTWRQQLDRVCVIDCSLQTQITRVKARNAWSMETILSVIHSQASRQQRLALADDVIVNEELSLVALQHRVVYLAQHWGVCLPALNHT